MPKQPTKKRKAEPHNRPKDTKKLQNASYQPALNSPPCPASVTASSLSERAPLLSLTEDSVDKSSASTASTEKHSSSPSAARASSTSTLQEMQPNYSGVQETEELSWRDFSAMSRDQLKEYARSRGWNVPSDDERDTEYDSDDDPYQREIDAWKEGELIEEYWYGQ